MEDEGHEVLGVEVWSRSTKVEVRSREVDLKLVREEHLLPV